MLFVSVYCIKVSAGCQLTSLDIYSLAKDSFFFSYLLASKDDSQFSSICIDTTREAYLVLASERTYNVEGYVEAIHFVCLVGCVCRCLYILYRHLIRLSITYHKKIKDISKIDVSHCYQTTYVEKTGGKLT